MMSSTMILLDRDVFFDELRTVFDAQTTETLLRVLDRVAKQVLAISVPREDFSDLKRTVAELAEMHRESARDWQELKAKLDVYAEEHRKFEKEIQRSLSVQEQMLADIQTLKTDGAEAKADIRELKADVRELKTDMTQVKADVGKLQTDVGKLQTDVGKLQTDVGKLQTDVGTLKGDSLEAKYRDRAPNYFGRLLRRTKVVDINSIVERLEAHLTEDEFNAVLLADLIVRGKPRSHPEQEDVWLVIEVSWTVDVNDVRRARQRADFLVKSGFRAIPAAAGEELTKGADVEARAQGVVIVQNGRNLFWNEALARLSTS